MRRRLAAIAVVCSLLPAAGAEAASDPLRPKQWALDMIQSDPAHAITRGEGAVVAIIDTGVAATHPDLQGRVLGGTDIVERDGTPQDGDGHGTHVLGIAGAAEDNGVGVASVAPGAAMLPVRVLDDEGAGSLDDVVAGIDYAIGAGADVINLSIGETFPFGGGSGQLAAAIERATARGIVVAAAAGNSGLPVCENPAAGGRVLCVGAVDRRRGRSLFSNFGSGLALVAPGGSGLPFPGEDVLSTYLGGGYAEVAGTSQAVPHVSGVAALLVSRGVRGQDAVRRILATATDIGAPGPDGAFGAGIVNARAAVNGLPGPGAPAAPPADQSSAYRLSFRRVQRIRDVLRRGIRVRCLAAGAGRCVVAARARGRLIASGSRRVKAGDPVTVRAMPTREGRRLLRRVRRLRVRLTIRLPGAELQRRTLLLRR